MCSITNHVVAGAVIGSRRPAACRCLRAGRRLARRHGRDAALGPPRPLGVHQGRGRGRSRRPGHHGDARARGRARSAGRPWWPACSAPACPTRTSRTHLFLGGSPFPAWVDDAAPAHPERGARADAVRGGRRLLVARGARPARRAAGRPRLGQARARTTSSSTPSGSEPESSTAEWNFLTSKALALALLGLRAHPLDLQPPDHVGRRLARASRCSGRPRAGTTPSVSGELATM